MSDPRREDDWDDEHERTQIEKRLRDEVEEPVLPSEEERRDNPLAIMEFQLKLHRAQTSQLATLHADRKKFEHRTDQKFIGLNRDFGEVSAEILSIKNKLQLFDDRTKIAMDAAIAAVSKVEGLQSSMKAMEETWTGIFNRFEKRATENFVTKAELKIRDERIDSLEKRFQYFQNILEEDVKLRRGELHERAAETPRVPYVADEPGDAGDPTSG